MSPMSTPTVIEMQLHLEAVTSDPFVADLSRPKTEPPRYLAEPSGHPRRRIVD
jgi:hypothetical protein